MKFIYNFLERAKRMVFKFNQRRIDEKIAAASHSATSFFFIQIGSNDGISGDPIYKYVKNFNWHGILIEPVEYLYKKLLANYQGQQGLFFENVAIDKSAGYKNFYSLKNLSGTGHVAWYEKLGSFNKEHLLKHKDKVPDFDLRLMEQSVKCVTFKSLLAKYAVTKINLLHIDAESYDYEIIKTIPFEIIKPAMILYENKHLNIGDKQDCKKLLRSHGYKFIKSKDTFAYL